MVKYLPAVKVVYSLHQGPYEQIGETYSKIALFIQQNQIQILPPTREVYLTDPNTLPPEEWLTEVQYPLKM